jgi:peptidoglycan/xylan/chitin deacetylase (PgdA/CDA1 family)
MYLGRTIDVGAQFTSSIDYVLALLDEYQTKVTFYVIASQAVQQPAAVREIVSRGHELGSHGWVTRLQTAVSSPKS